jgi:hypothetical protein
VRARYSRWGQIRKALAELEPGRDGRSRPRLDRVRAGRTRSWWRRRHLRGGSAAEACNEHEEQLMAAVQADILTAC